MRDPQLSDLNFRELLEYGGQPSVAARYDPPLSCNGYCVRCEDEGLVQKSGGRLDLMSHGCDSADFEAIIGPMPTNDPIPGVKKHILFLLENPGMDFGNGKVVPFKGLEKQPPVNVYYFAPTTNIWPDGRERFGGNFYGPYFAYLMWKHQLTNVYITNLVKCRYRRVDGTPASTPFDINKNCIDLYLRREIEIFAPKLIVCFGQRAERGFKSAYPETTRLPHVYLMHPSYICDRWQASGKTQDELLKENDERLRGAIMHLA
jgi:Uracil DNA glycosylase superfamily